ncbi:MAG: DEAD/DEAH box helicase [Clostridiales bacterium]|mgnify:CR=1 FL=1|nr:DEAD/DEAH box helicase [Clostridiales bacterium]
MEQTRYEDSNIDPRIIKAVKEMGFEAMTPIQEQTIPLLLEGRDVVGQAQTGTGKTASFGIPAVQNYDPTKKSVQTIILCPTRELAIQAAEEIRKFAKYMQGVSVLPIYGGQDITRQIKSLKAGATIVVGTPGRVMDHMRRHTLKLDDIKMVVLDEADEMLNMGFREDIETILAGIPNSHQTALFSATMPKAILDIIDQYQEDAVNVKIARKELTIPLVKQYYYEVRRENKAELVTRLIDYYNPKLTLIFCNTKRMVEELAETLKGRGYFAEGLHGDLSQAQRDKVMRSFRSGSADILIATDVAARGIDVDDVEAVINFDIPQDIEYYVHRIGRTGRAGRKGRAFTFCFGRDIYKIRDIERSCKTVIKARRIPSAADITAAKSDKILAEVIEVMNEKDISAMTRIIEEKLNDEDITALDLCAAFLKVQMGEEISDIPEVNYRDYRRGGNGGRSYGNGNGGNYGRGRGDGRQFGGNYGRRQGGDGDRSYRRRESGDGERRYVKRDDGRKDGAKRDGGRRFGRRDDYKSGGQRVSNGRGGYTSQKSDKGALADGSKPKDIDNNGNPVFKVKKKYF